MHTERIPLSRRGPKRRLAARLVKLSDVKPGDLFAGADRDNGHDSQVFGREVIAVMTNAEGTTALRLERSGGFMSVSTMLVWVLREES